MAVKKSLDPAVIKKPLTIYTTPASINISFIYTPKTKHKECFAYALPSAGYL